MGVAVVLVVAGTASAVALTRATSDASDDAAAAPPKFQTAEVTRTDLSETEKAKATLAYGAERSLAGRKQGTITAVPAAGTVIERGQQVYAVNAAPVVLFYGTMPFFRDLSIDSTDGPDIEVLEENLTALGFFSGTVDRDFTAKTAEAIEDWQESLGMEETGALSLGDVVVEPGPVRVKSVSAQVGAEGNGDLMKITGTDRTISAEIDAQDAAMAPVGAKVTLTLPDGTETTGTVTSVVPVPADDSESPGQDTTPKLTVTITPDDQAATASTLEAAQLAVEFTTGSRPGVLVVPVGALLALREGGFAVEVVEDGENRLVAVELGLFADGMVEVSGPDLAEGMTVVTTS